MTEGEEGVQASRELMLPSRELQGIWENLIFDEGIKEKLLRYVNMGKHYPLLVHTFSLRIFTLIYSSLCISTHIFQQWSSLIKELIQIS